MSKPVSAASRSNTEQAITTGDKSSNKKVAKVAIKNSDGPHAENSSLEPSAAISNGPADEKPQKQTKGGALQSQSSTAAVARQQSTPQKTEPSTLVDEIEDSHTQLSAIYENKLRNLQKRVKRLEQLRDESKSGKALGPEQQAAADRYDEAVAQSEGIREMYQMSKKIMETNITNLKKATKRDPYRSSISISSAGGAASGLTGAGGDISAKLGRFIAYQDLLYMLLESPYAEKIRTRIQIDQSTTEVLQGIRKVFQPQRIQFQRSETVPTFDQYSRLTAMKVLKLLNGERGNVAKKTFVEARDLLDKLSEHEFMQNIQQKKSATTIGDNTTDAGKVDDELIKLILSSSGSAEAGAAGQQATLSGALQKPGSAVTATSAPTNDSSRASAALSANAYPPSHAATSQSSHQQQTYSNKSISVNDHTGENAPTAAAAAHPGMSSSIFRHVQASSSHQHQQHSPGTVVNMTNQTPSTSSRPPPPGYQQHADANVFPGGVGQNSNLPSSSSYHSHHYATTGDSSSSFAVGTRSSQQQAGGMEPVGHRGSTQAFGSNNNTDGSSLNMQFSQSMNISDPSRAVGQQQQLQQPRRPSAVGTQPAHAIGSISAGEPQQRAYGDYGAQSEDKFGKSSQHFQSQQQQQQQQQPNIVNNPFAASVDQHSSQQQQPIKSTLDSADNNAWPSASAQNGSTGDAKQQASIKSVGTGPTTAATSTAGAEKGAGNKEQHDAAAVASKNDNDFGTWSVPTRKSQQQQNAFSGAAGGGGAGNTGRGGGSMGTYNSNQQRAHNNNNGAGGERLASYAGNVAGGGGGSGGDYRQSSSRDYSQQQSQRGSRDTKAAGGGGDYGNNNYGNEKRVGGGDRRGGGGGGDHSNRRGGGGGGGYNNGGSYENGSSNYRGGGGGERGAGDRGGRGSRGGGGGYYNNNKHEDGDAGGNYGSKGSNSQQQNKRSGDTNDQNRAPAAANNAR